MLPSGGHRSFPSGFLFGASTSAHQTEGNNVNSDAWHAEVKSGGERSGDAVDSYHRYGEDMRLLADAGLNAYRFSIEWARIEPIPGHISRAALAHYRRMIDTAIDLGLTPLVTLHHFTSPRWFAKRGGWLGEGAVQAFTRYVEAAIQILGGVHWVCTINEPNIAALIAGVRRKDRPAGLPFAGGHIVPDAEVGGILAEAHRAVSALIRRETGANVGWTVAQQNFVAEPGHERVHAILRHEWEDFYLRVGRHDDFLGVQTYTSQVIDSTGVVPHPPHPDNTQTGWAYRPDALGMALRRAAEVAPGVPLLVTENGIATADDRRRIAYTAHGLRDLLAVVAEGVDVRGYLHWSALDNFEWGHWEPTFGLIAVDRTTFARRPKPSLAWLGGVARANALPPTLDHDVEGAA